MTMRFIRKDKQKKQVVLCGKITRAKFRKNLCKILHTHNFTSTQPIPTSKYISDSSGPMLHINIGFAFAPINGILCFRYYD
jgi:hypothetical protein